MQPCRALSPLDQKASRAERLDSGGALGSGVWVLRALHANRALHGALEKCLLVLNASQICPSRRSNGVTLYGVQTISVYRA